MEFIYPKKMPAPAIIVAHGLRSYYTGFLDMFAKALVEAGYIAVKFHFVGTGKSDGKFEEKSTAMMLKNYEDVLDFVAKDEQVRGIGLLARSNAASLDTIHGPDKRIKARVYLGPPAFYSLDMAKFVESAKIQGKFFVHKSFKRPHTKGPGRLPLTYPDELKKYDKPLLKNIAKMKTVALFQSRQDEAVPVEEGHFDYWAKHLPKPKSLVLVDSTNHSFAGKKKLVIAQAVGWFRKYLPDK